VETSKQMPVSRYDTSNCYSCRHCVVCLLW